MHVALDAIAAAEQAGGGRQAGRNQARLRIEHFDNCTAGDLARLPALAARGLVARVQPTHCHPVYVATIARVLGPERMRREYPLASLLRAGLPVALNSDWPAAMTFAPMENLRAAVEHTGGEAQTRAEALHALTRGNAYAARRERELGAIAPGYCADAVLLDGDPLAPGESRPVATLVAGEWVAGSASLPCTAFNAGYNCRMELMRKITVALPASLIRQAQRASGAGLTATLRQGLVMVTEAGAADRLRALRGRVQFSVDWRELRRDR